MSVVIVTGSSGLIGSEAARFFHEKGLDVVGIDNDLRKYFFGSDGSTEWNKRLLEKDLSRFTHYSCDIRDEAQILKVFEKYKGSIHSIIHTAAQPSHDWAAKEPLTDFTVNALGTTILLEATRKFAPEAPFIFTSTNKVYGDTPNFLPLVETSTRWELDRAHKYAEHGIDESMSIDQSKHSVFGASKVGADVMVQEYGRYFGMKTATFRGGCLTGPAHSGAELHGFLAYLIKCVVTGRPYKVFGYKGKQVRDNIHSYDLVNAFWHFTQAPRSGEVYNIGGSRFSNCSMIEAIRMSEEVSGKTLDFTLVDDNRIGDHIWWVSDIRKFKEHYSGWKQKFDINTIVKEIVEATQEREGIN
ncbi:MAG: NAD-dependent epimerase [Bdellovibrionales bacterium CG10_big_fil_rev_8_21_14_0_10_45_34]|nr:MAG: NAD-dependent epimerase [Bdellovibrionales bacterium CG10_big_fil_rev_8_21_14_0_10_45_34]